MAAFRLKALIEKVHKKACCEMQQAQSKTVNVF